MTFSNLAMIYQHFSLYATFKDPNTQSVWQGQWFYSYKKEIIWKQDAVEITSSSPSASSASLSLPQAFLFPQIEASERYSLSFNSEIYSTANRLIKFINKPQYIKRCSIDLAAVSYNQTSFYAA